MSKGLPTIWLLLSLLSDLTGAQTVPSVELCTKRVVDLFYYADHNWGILNYNITGEQSQLSLPCETTIELAFWDVVLTGLQLMNMSGSCSSHSQVAIEDVAYCVKGSSSSNPVYIATTKDNNALSVRVKHVHGGRFSLNYYNSVPTCGKVYFDKIHPFYSSGVLKEPDLADDTGQNCTFLFEIPSAAIKLKFLQANGVKVKDEKGQTLLPGEGRDQALIRSPSTIVIEPAPSGQLKFLILFTVLFCEEPHGVNLTTANFSANFSWLPGTELRSGYECLDGWKLDGARSATCVVNNAAMDVRWTKTACVPVVVEVRSETDAEVSVILFACVIGAVMISTVGAVITLLVWKWRRRSPVETRQNAASEDAASGEAVTRSTTDLQTESEKENATLSP